ncbi:ComC/BlpC family leader-containing pheromone/bacteriocin [Leuconostoc mesenteroides]|uniref:ComC/BlpC family leader-containing pheromone/bacteriocin n=1 Tax=Leuconostoc mesenteroides TaxID=1245 RepID=UPI002078D679|nr:ComC/BlpC family leader-containing pheromone/bacteriocin [Leuconostoc mesenteroides]USI45907.1 ComC/BlpC family leader-containing pheromone/bacteriocin [Leuconostoc mesenteroides]
MNSQSLTSLSEFEAIDNGQLEQIEGGIFPLIIGGVVITKGAVITGGLLAGVAGVGAYVGYKAKKNG